MDCSMRFPTFCSRLSRCGWDPGHPQPRRSSTAPNENTVLQQAYCGSSSRMRFDPPDAASCTCLTKVTTRAEPSNRAALSVLSASPRWESYSSAFPTMQNARDFTQSDVTFVTFEPASADSNSAAPANSSSAIG